MKKYNKIISLIFIGLYFGLSSFIAIATQVSSPSTQSAAAASKSGWPIMTLEVTNTTPDTISANQIFARDVSIEFPDTIPSQQTRTFQLSMVGGNVRGFIYFYVKGQPAATRLSFDGKTVKVQEFMGQPLSIDLEGQDCIDMDGVPACVWVGNTGVTIKTIVKYTNSSPR